MLIRDGAQAVLSGKDIIKNYAYIYRDSIDLTSLSRSEAHSDIDMRAIRDMEISLRYVKKSEKTNDKTSLPQKVSEKNQSEESIPMFAPPEKTKKTEKAKKENPEAKIEKSEQKVAYASDKSPEILAGLSDKQRRIFESMPFDKPISVESLVNLGFSMGEIMASLTVLEIKGLISSLPGALYIRK